MHAYDVVFCACISSVVHMMYRRLSAVTWCAWRHCA